MATPDDLAEGDGPVQRAGASSDAVALEPDPGLAAFAGAWRGSDPAVVARVAPRLRELGAAARTAHPALPVDEVRLLAAIGARAPSAEAELCAYLGRCRAAELWLALEAAAGRAEAITAIERAHAAMIDGVCRRFASPAQGPDDLHQILRARLFVPEPGRPAKIADYAGQGFLENWLRITAVRVFLDLGKRKDRAREQAGGDDAALALASPDDLALELVKQEYRAAVAEALREASTRLAAGDRHLLRQHLVAGLTIDQLGAALGIHRATAARRITRAREQLIAETRQAVARRLAISAAEIDSVIALVMSRLDVSLSKLFASDPR